MLGRKMGNEVFASRGLTRFGPAQLQHPAINWRAAKIVVKTDDAQRLGFRDVERIGDERDCRVVDVAELNLQIVKNGQGRVQIERLEGAIEIPYRIAFPSSPRRLGGWISAAISAGNCIANRLRASGEGGSRLLITRPMVRCATGSTSSIVRVARGTAEK